MAIKFNQIKVTTMIDTSWEHALNPDNTPWKPGYRFSVEQLTDKRGSRRKYHVCYRINRAGELEWRGPSGGVKPRPETTAKWQAIYDRERGK